ncbi:hypothetical protein MSAN_01155500 [Mycena sanguinolenta]|uniref:Uncharacterized protein n=1 Tax=Mycena sanguinolenta TaxID=230812 RepID=A0A8H6YMV8_9AGAR|nr:hypothetical protein MSAN_01155500 [Mycena sanguinolenta]
MVVWRGRRGSASGYASGETRSTVHPSISDLDRDASDHEHPLSSSSPSMFLLCLLTVFPRRLRPIGLALLARRVCLGHVWEDQTNGVYKLESRVCLGHRLLPLHFVLLSSLKASCLHLTGLFTSPPSSSSSPLRARCLAFASSSLLPPPSSPLLHTINTLQPVPMKFGPQTYDEFRDELWEEVFSQDTYGPTLPTLRDVYGFFESVIALASPPEEYEDSLSMVPAPTSALRLYPESLFTDFEQPTFRTLPPRPYLAGSVALNTIIPCSFPSSTGFAQPVVRLIGPAHALKILPIAVQPPPSAAYFILGHVLLGLSLGVQLSLAAVILALRWAVAPASSVATRTQGIQVGDWPSTIPGRVLEVLPSLDKAVLAASCTAVLQVVEEPRPCTGTEDVDPVEECETATFVDPQVVEIVQQSTEDVEQVKESKAVNSTTSVDAPQVVRDTPTHPAVEPTPPSSPISSVELDVTALSERVRSETAPRRHLVPDSGTVKTSGLAHSWLRDL